MAGETSANSSSGTAKTKCVAMYTFCIVMDPGMHTLEWVSTKPGLWTGLDYGLVCGLDNGLDYGGVAGIISSP